MKIGLRYARLSAAIIAALGSATTALADNYIYDPQLTGTATGSDITPGGMSNWDAKTMDWVDQTTPAGDVAWPNTGANSAIIGTTANGSVATTIYSDTLQLTTSINVQNITLQAAYDGTNYYNYDIADDGSGENLTLGGNFIKASAVGESTIQLSGNFALTGGQTHVFAINDTPGAVPELSFFSAITGSDSITLNNAYNNSGYTEYGTLVLDVDNPNFSGGFNVVDGALTANTSLALGTGAVNISSAGALEFGGNGSKQNSATLTVTNPITISRSDYTDTNFNDYTDSIIETNSGIAGSTLNLNGQLVIDSTDARIAAQTSTVNINQAFTIGPDVGTSTPLADLDGDYAGLINLNADNTAYGAAGGAIGFLGGVEVDASTIGELGGQGSKLVLNGGTLHITSALLSSDPNLATNFGAGTSHTINTSAVSTGVDVDKGLTFTVNGLSGGGVGMRGGGTLDFTGTNTFTGTPYYDGVDDGPGEGTENDTTATGIVNFEAGSTSTQVGLRIRSATVNVAGTLNVGGTYTSIGADSTGSNGTPDYGTVNISGNGAVIENSGDDFNVSDNANTHGTINLSGNGNLTVGGTLYIGKNSGAVGTVTMNGTSSLDTSSLVFVGQNDGTGVLTQNSGSINLTRNGNFTFVINDGRGGTGAGSGTYNFNGGTFTSAGEVYVGEGGNGNNATWNQTGGTAVLSNWLVFGREGGSGTMNLSGGSLTRTDGGTIGDDPGNQTSIGEGAKASTLNVTGTGQFVVDTGELYFGNNSGTGVLNLGTPGMTTETASVTVNNWLAVGRSGASTGTINVYDGTLTQATNNWFDISGDGGSSTGTVNVYGGTVNALQMYLGENGSGHAYLNINGGNVNITNNSVFANGNSVTGNLNLNGGTLTAYGFTAQNGGGTGASTFDWNGGTLAPNTNNTNFIGGKITSIVSAGGAKVTTTSGGNNYAVTINSALTHDSTLGTTRDGGLTVSGGGTLTLAGANSYTGLTTQTSGTLVVNASSETPIIGTSAGVTTSADAGENLQGGSTVFTYTSSTNDPIAAIQTDLTNSYNASGGHFASGQIYSSTAVSGKYGLGYIDNTSTDQVTVKYTLYGDANLDGTVDAADFVLLSNNFGKTGTTWNQGNFNYDNSTDAADFVLLSNNFGQSIGGAAVDYLDASELATFNQDATNFGFSAAQISVWDANVTGVPEPTSLLLAGIGAAGLLRRRVRRIGRA